MSKGSEMQWDVTEFVFLTLEEPHAGEGSKPLPELFVAVLK